LAAEAAGLRESIERMRRQLPGLAARQRSIDPDLLEQEMLIALGRNPGDEAAVGLERKMAGLEKTAGAADALAALKAKMGLAPAAPAAPAEAAAPAETTAPADEPGPAEGVEP
jgi:hypothetical protein